MDWNGWSEGIVPLKLCSNLINTSYSCLGVLKFAPANVGLFVPIS